MVELKMTVHVQTFASFNNECLWLVNYVFIVKHSRYGKEPQIKKVKVFTLETFLIYGITTFCKYITLWKHINRCYFKA